jgi:hypothetical protein
MTVGTVLGKKPPTSGQVITGTNPNTVMASPSHGAEGGAVGEGRGDPPGHQHAVGGCQR